jgi:hypothetical protein
MTNAAAFLRRLRAALASPDQSLARADLPPPPSEASGEVEALRAVIREAREIVGTIKPYLIKNRDRYRNVLDKVSAFQEHARAALGSPK